jgi:hypothetical protein
VGTNSIGLMPVTRGLLTSNEAFDEVLRAPADRRIPTQGGYKVSDDQNPGMLGQRALEASESGRAILQMDKRRFPRPHRAMNLLSGLAHRVPQFWVRATQCSMTARRTSRSRRTMRCSARLGTATEEESMIGVTRMFRWRRGTSGQCTSDACVALFRPPARSRHKLLYVSP